MAGNEALIVVPSGNLPAEQEDQLFAAMSTSATYLPRLQLITAKSEKVSDGFPVNHFALISGSTNIDLGPTVDCVPVAWRPCFVDMNDDQVLAYYKPDFDKDGVPQSAECKDIQARSEIQNSKCMWGPQFLVWVPGKKTFALVLMGSKSARREAPVIKARIGFGTTLIAKKCESKKFPTWYIISARPCSVLPDDLPAQEQLAKTIETFRNPPDNEVEAAEEAPAGAARER